jgi:DNA repair exonuclease SbcCD ATPase subunit
MSDEQTKPREFEFEIFETLTGLHCDMVTNHPAGNYHTIEYRALTALQKENEALKAKEFSSLIHKECSAEIKSLRDELTALQKENEHKSMKIDWLLNDSKKLLEEIKSLRDELIDLKKERDQLRSGCYACEGVAVMNKDLEKKLEIAIEALERLQAGYAGMFGYPGKTPKDDAWDFSQIVINIALAKLQSKGDV